jgi:hypothetical protein
MGKILANNMNGNDTCPILWIEYPEFLPYKIIIYNPPGFSFVDKNMGSSFKTISKYDNKSHRLNISNHSGHYIYINTHVTLVK